MKRIRASWKPSAILVILSVAVLSASLAQTVHAQPPIISTFKAATVTGRVGDIRTVTVYVYDAEILWSWQVFMSWDPAVLDFVLLAFGDFLKVSPYEPAQAATLDYVSDGWLMCSEARFGGEPGVTAESGLLVSIAFEILSLTTTTVNIDSVYTFWMDEILGPTEPWGDDPGELIKENGGFVPPWIEDINMDGFIDVLDLAYVAINYGKGPGDDINPPEADVNGDTYVDIYDLSMVALKYGQYTEY